VAIGQRGDERPRERSTLMLPPVLQVQPPMTTSQQAQTRSQIGRERTLAGAARYQRIPRLANRPRTRQQCPNRP
jgi:hypothetical protein